MLGRVDREGLLGRWMLGRLEDWERLLGSIAGEGVARKGATRECC